MRRPTIQHYKQAGLQKTHHPPAAISLASTTTPTTSSASACHNISFEKRLLHHIYFTSLVYLSIDKLSIDKTHIDKMPIHIPLLDKNGGI
jgi:hypothetical protein